jgi:hypothetical protein
LRLKAQYPTSWDDDHANQIIRPFADAISLILFDAPRASQAVVWHPHDARRNPASWLEQFSGSALDASIGLAFWW